MSPVVELLKRRLTRAEGERLLPYDDATGTTIHAPKGKITWGRGFNLEACGSPGLFDAMETYLLEDIERRLSRFVWYSADTTNDARCSVLMEIAYNAGVTGLLKFQRMLAAVTVSDWETAARECAVADLRLNDSRYKPLRAILRSGVAP